MPEETLQNLSAYPVSRIMQSNDWELDVLKDAGVFLIQHSYQFAVGIATIWKKVDHAAKAIDAQAKSQMSESYLG